MRRNVKATTMTTLCSDDNLTPADDRALKAGRILPERKLSPAVVEGVIRTARVYLDEHAIAREDAARQMGIASGTLSQFLARAYGANPDNVARKVNAWIEADARSRTERAAGADPTRELIHTHVVKTLIAVADVTASRPRFGIAYGASGIGKTAVIDYLCERHPGAVRVTITNDTRTHSGLRNALGRALRIRSVHGGRVKASYRDHEIIRKLKGTRRLIIVDEGHRMNDGAWEHLRDLVDLAEVSVLLLGTVDLKHRIGRDRIGDAGQRASRTAACVDLCRGRDPGIGGRPLFTLAQVRKFIEGDRVRPTDAAIREVTMQANMVGLGGLRRVEILVDIAARRARRVQELPLDAAVSVDVEHLAFAERFMADDGVRPTAAHVEAEPAVAAAG